VKVRLPQHLAAGLLLWGVAAAPLQAVVNPPALKWAANPSTQVGGCLNTADPPGYYCDTGWYASPAVADLNGDGQREVIWGGYDLFVLDGATGANLAVAPNGSRIWPGIAVADLSGDGSLEIVVGRSSNQLHVYHAVAGSPWTINTVFARNPFVNNCAGNGCEVRTLAVEDLENDGQLEIIVGRASGGDTEQLNVYDAFGNQRPGWPARHTGEAGYGWGMYNENVTLGDLDGDGLKEIFGPTDTHYVTALDPSGNQLPVNPMFLPDQVWSETGIHVLQSMDVQGYANCDFAYPLLERLRPNFANVAPAIADMDGDGTLEFVTLGDVYDCAVGDPAGDLYVMPWIFRKDRTRWSGSGFDWTDIPSPGPGSGPLSEDYNVIENNVHNTVLADLDGDGRKEILFPSYDGKLHAYWLDKTEHGSWPFVVPGTGIRFASEPVVADLDNDGQAEVIFTSWPEKVAGRLGQLFILNSMGQQLYAVDLPPAGAYVSTPWNGALGAPTISNIDADPDLEVVVGTVHAGVVAYDLPGSAGARILWGTGRGNFRRTGALDPAPAASIADAAVSEGNAGTTTATFTVSLAFAASGAVSVGYSTANGTATAGADYVAASGVLTFPPGATSRTLTVSVNGDLLDEVDETFFVNLSSPVGVTIADGQAVGTILDDDAPPTLSIADASAPEGSCSPSSLSLPVALSGPSGKTVSVSYATSGGTATPEVDYETSSGTLSLAPGATSAAVVVPLIGDLVDEPNETFTVALAAPVDVTIPDPLATATILDDDVPGALPVLELTHGSDLQADLAAQPGPVADLDVYAVSEKPRSSYEVVVDALSGDVAPLLVERRSCAGAVVQTGSPVGAGASLALRFENTAAVTVNTERITVSGACGASCDAADVYRIGLRETSLGIARFNNSGTQITILVLQNPTSAPVSGHIWFWSMGGGDLGSQPFTLAPRSTLTLNTATVVPSAGGSVLVSHDAPFGALAGKAVAVEPATGFTFDTPLKVRER
jgi:hypothetical protein